MHHLIEKTVPHLNTPTWATHIAFRPEVPKVEMVAWLEREQCYITEDPSTLSDGDMATVIDERYWKFADIKDVKKAVKTKQFETFTRDDAKKVIEKVSFRDQHATAFVIRKDGLALSTIRGDLSNRHEIEKHQKCFILTK